MLRLAFTNIRTFIRVPSCLVFNPKRTAKICAEDDYEFECNGCKKKSVVYTYLGASFTATEKPVHCAWCNQKRGDESDELHDKVFKYCGYWKRVCPFEDDRLFRPAPLIKSQRCSECTESKPQ